MLAGTNPAVKVYDPAYGYEIAHIVRAGLEEMFLQLTAADAREPLTTGGPR